MPSQGRILWQHLCWKCSSKNLVEQKISRRGRVFIFTKDHLVRNPDPPTVMVAADLDGGGRFYGQLTDCDPARVTFEMPVELCFRLIHEGGRTGQPLLDVFGPRALVFGCAEPRSERSH